MILIEVMLAVIFAINAGIYSTTKPYIKENMADLDEAQAALIPGAAIFSNGRLSPVFEARADGAIELYKKGLVSKILVSGDNSTVYHNEVNPVRDYLLRKGIPDEDIFLDHAGFDTYSTMYRARKIFQVKSVIISTQSFHLPRSVFLARSFGMKTQGYRADTAPSSFKNNVHNHIREVLADEKAFMNVLLKREPKFLGDQIPITEDGRNYP
jgi:SanA protein